MELGSRRIYFSLGDNLGKDTDRFWKFLGHNQQRSPILTR